MGALSNIGCFSKAQVAAGYQGLSRAGQRVSAEINCREPRKRLIVECVSECGNHDIQMQLAILAPSMRKETSMSDCL